MPDIALTVNGQRYAGWTSARVTRGIESIAGGFELTVSDRWEAGQAPWAIYEGDECTVSVNGVTVLTGYVDKRRVSFSAGEHSLSVSGRDKTSLLVDASWSGPPWEWLNTPLLTLAERLAEPHGIPVRLAAGLVPGPAAAKLTADAGDSGFEVLEKACRRYGVLPVSDGAGGLTLMRPGAERVGTALVEGENILAGSADFDSSGRFYRYLVLGQHPGSVHSSGENVSAVKGEATDAGVRQRSRVLIVRPEGTVTPALAKRRAEWEATVRAARGDNVAVTVQGWLMGDGALWPVNALVAVKSPRLGIDGSLLITQTVFNVGAEGTTTELTLRRPDAFAPDPTVAAPTKGGTNYWKEIERGV